MRSVEQQIPKGVSEMLKVVSKVTDEDLVKGQMYFVKTPAVECWEVYSKERCHKRDWVCEIIAQDEFDRCFDIV